MDHSTTHRASMTSLAVLLTLLAIPQAGAVVQAPDEPIASPEPSDVRLESRSSLELSRWIRSDSALADNTGWSEQPRTIAPAPIAQRVLLSDTVETGIEPSLRDDEEFVLNPRLQMSVGRSSSLLDGGIAAERGLSSDPLRGFAGAQGNLDLYDLSLRWAAYNPGPIELSLMGGVRAIQSVGGMWRTEATASGAGELGAQAGAQAGVTETYDQDRSLVTLPVIGGGMRVSLFDGVVLSTSATTHTSGSADAFFDMVMETSINLGDGVGLHAGYQEIRTASDTAGLFEPLRESGLFARLTIEF